MSRLKTDVNFQREYIIYDYCSIWRRVLGKVIDIIVLLVISFWVAKAQVNSYWAMFFVAFDLFYYTFFIYFFGRTIGMWVVRAKAISTKGKKVTIGQAVIRELSSKVSNYLLGIGDLWMLLNDSNQTWHDILASTVVVNKKSARDIEEHIATNPWPEIRRINMFRIIALVISINIIFYTCLDRLVNSYGKFGISQVDTVSSSLKILDAKCCSFNSNGTKQLITLSMEAEKPVIKVYTPSKGKLLESESMKTEGENIIEKALSCNFDIDDVDNDSKKELILTQMYNSNGKIINELVIYRNEASQLLPICGVAKVCKDREYNHTNISTFVDSEKKHHIIWTNNYEIASYVYDGKQIKEEFKNYLSSNSSKIIKADFIGTKKEELYTIQQMSSNLQVSKLSFEDKLAAKNCNEVMDDITCIEKDFDGAVRASDINNDGKDELILMDEENGVKGRKLLDRKESKWLNIYSFTDNQWRKIWTGGNIKSSCKDKYVGNIDADGDGKLEIVMTNNCDINVYKYKASLFKVNTLWQRVYEFIK